MWHRKIQRTRHSNRKTASIEFAYESKQTSRYSPRALVAVLCVTRIRGIQTTLPAEGLSALSDNSCYWWLRRRWRRNCESAEIATRDHQEPSHPGCGAGRYPACRANYQPGETPGCPTGKMPVLRLEGWLGLRSSHLRCRRFLFSPAGYSFDDVKRDRNEKDRDC